MEAENTPVDINTATATRDLLLKRAMNGNK
jgi:hypothetical protein